MRIFGNFLTFSLSLACTAPSVSFISTIYSDLTYCSMNGSVSATACFNDYRTPDGTAFMSTNTQCAICIDTLYTALRLGTVQQACAASNNFNPSLIGCGAATLGLRQAFATCWGGNTDPVSGRADLDLSHAQAFASLDADFKPFGPIVSWAVRASSNESVDVRTQVDKFMKSEYRDNGVTAARFRSLLSSLGTSVNCYSDFATQITAAASNLRVECFGVVGQYERNRETHCDFRSGIFLDKVGSIYPYCEWCLAETSMQQALKDFYICSGHSLDTSFVNQYTGPIEAIETVDTSLTVTTARPSSAWTEAPIIMSSAILLATILNN